MCADVSPAGIEGGIRLSGYKNTKILYFNNPTHYYGNNLGLLSDVTGCWAKISAHRLLGWVLWESWHLIRGDYEGLDETTQGTMTAWMRLPEREGGPEGLRSGNYHKGEGDRRMMGI
ncbi:hypothetical protein BDZ91DRAFT_765028 [Kalaharituber pfeilii]|nr:hypothetical protein BDZ91DRAFT_765028 [Kalaharituber pfeilii]